MTQKKQVLCGLQGIFRLFNCQTPGHKENSPGHAGLPIKRRSADVL